MTLKVILGEFDTKNEEGNEVIIPAKKVINHSRYNKRTNDNDITLVELSSKAPFSDNIKPICMPTSRTDFPTGTMCTVSGFGTIRSNGPQSRYLLKANVPLVEHQECKRSYRSLTENMVCAGYEQGGIDSCQGDSGGPLVCPQNGKFYLTGVVSYGIGCAKPGYPGVYAKVKNYLDWIETTRSG